MSNRKFLSEQLVGKTVNLFSDRSLKKMAEKVVIKNFKQDGRKFIIEVTPEKKRPGLKSYELIFFCNPKNQMTHQFWVNAMIWDNGKREDVWNDKMAFNSDLAKELNTKFCGVSKGGTVVPKADFTTKVGQDSETPMTEGRRAVRLTESDLIRLVKKVLIEQNNPNKEK